MMMVVCVMILLATAAGSAPPVVDGFVVRGETQLAPGTYQLTSPIRIVEDGSRLDLTGVVLASSHAAGPADSFADTALIVEGAHGVVIANATIRGFKLGLYARECTGLVITGCDVSGTYRQRLHSTPERENATDWLWPHHNDDHQWAAHYGAGIYLDRCRAADVSGNTGHDGQNGIVLSQTDSSCVYDNDMSFNSGWGLAMWRSCANEISHNRFDYCVRGYSHGVYRRGQDSAGILVFEQCSDNVFAFNSATHGGDGFFLYAGHETLERTGTGGSNRNLLYGNDFSHAVANGIEATFSEGNRFLRNTIDECEYGVWAGYSYGTDIAGNQISRCARAGIAIEHGHDNRIEGNTFKDNRVGVLVWAFPNAELDSSTFGRRQDTRSERYLIRGNRFHGDSTAVRLHNTGHARIEKNDFNPADVALTLKASCPGMVFQRNRISGGRLLAESECLDTVYLLANAAEVDSVQGEVVVLDSLTPPPGSDESRPPWQDRRPLVKGSMVPFIPEDGLRGRATMVIDEWGPVRPGPHVFPRHAAGWGDTKVFTAGEDQHFDVSFVAGSVYADPLSGRAPASILVTPVRRGFVTATLQIACGDETYEVERAIASSTWIVRFYGWEAALPEETLEDWATVVGGEPLDSLTSDRVDFWWDGKVPTDRVPPEYFATVGETAIDLPAGTYVAHTISDDGVRLYVDDKPVIQNWTAHFVAEDRGVFTVSTGLYRIRVEHYQTDGSSWLQVWLTR